MVQYSETTMNYELKPMGVGGILDQSILILKNHFSLFLKIALCLQIPTAVGLNLFVVHTMPAPSREATPEEVAELMRTQFQFLSTFLPILMVWMLIVIPIMNAVIVHAAASIYLGRPVSVGSSFRAGLKRAMPLIWTSSLLFFFVVVGTMLCVLPGILLAFLFALAPTVVVLERVSGLKALQRSWYLMRTAWLEHFLTYFLLGILIGGINSGIGAGSQFVFEQRTAAIVSAVLQGVSWSLGYVAGVVFYFSCRCRVENFDLVRLAEAVAAAPTVRPEALPQP
jgi:hypothetical protein